MLKSNKTKMEQLRTMVSNTKAYVIVLTETWLTEDILDQEVKISGFNIFRSDQSGNIRGGICIYLRADISAAICLQSSKGLTEALVLKIKSLKLCIFTIYKSQLVSTTHFQETIDEVKSSIDLAQAHGAYPNIMGFGDFNLP